MCKCFVVINCEILKEQLKLFKILFSFARRA